MLDTIQQEIENLGDDSFESFFLQYIEDVQDGVVEREASALQSRVFNTSNIHDPEKMINAITEALLNDKLI